MSPCSRIVKSDGCPTMVGTKTFSHPVSGSILLLQARPPLNMPSTKTPAESWCVFICFESSLFSVILSGTVCDAWDYLFLQASCGSAELRRSYNGLPDQMSLEFKGVILRGTLQVKWTSEVKGHLLSRLWAHHLSTLPLRETQVPP